MFGAFPNWLSKFIGSAKPFVLLAMVFTSGCGRDEIQVYNVPKEKSSPMAEATMPASHPDLTAPATAPRLKWKTPDGWKEVHREMRVASFKVMGKDGKQADVSVIPLPGAAGGDLSNVNRWRGQVGQAAVSEEELKKLAQAVELAGQPATLFEQNGENGEGVPTRILAVIQRRNDMAWFFKMTGDNELVAQQRPVFVEFLKSVQFTTGETVATAQPAASPPSADRPQWTAPSNWKEVPGGQFLIAKFAIAGDGNAQAAVNISSSAGDGGGLAANINRWRKQLGLSELSADDLAKSGKPIDTVGGKATLVEMTGKDARTGQPSTLVGAIVLQPGQAWFYKLMGDVNIVASQKDAFAKFVQEVKY